MPHVMRKFLLATGERGLSMDYVDKLSAREFEEFWLVREYVQMAATENGQQTLAIHRSAILSDRIEAADESYRGPEIIDPMTLSPTELQEYAERLAREQGMIQ